MASSSTKLEIIPGKDRFFSATRPIQPGEILLIDQPLLYPASLSYLEIFCSNCFRVVSSEQFRCMTCKIARFCSARCHSSSHPTLLCHALPSLIADELSHTPALLFLLCVYSASADSILQLISLPCPYSPQDSLIEYLETQFVRLIPRNRIPRHFSHGMIFKILSVGTTYGLPIHGQSDLIDCDVEDIRAYGLSFPASLVKHSCLPNSCVFSDVDDPNRQGDTTFVFKALDWIGEGKEISRSFIDDHLEMKYDDRFNMLKDLIGFECKCHRCDTEEIWEKNKLTVDKGKRQLIASYAHFIDHHVCHHCRGCLAPFPPSQDGVISTLMQCNKCGDQVTKNQPDSPAAEDASSSTA